jgi:hypothetical protein
VSDVADGCLGQKRFCLVPEPGGDIDEVFAISLKVKLGNCKLS